MTRHRLTIHLHERPIVTHSGRREKPRKARHACLCVSAIIRLQRRCPIPPRTAKDAALERGTTQSLSRGIRTPENRGTRQGWTWGRSGWYYRSTPSRVGCSRRLRWD